MDDNPVMIPGPGTECALVKSDHDAILCVPEEYCSDTVFPVALFSPLAIFLEKRQTRTDIGEFAVFENHKIELL